MSGKPVKISVAIITLNEEKNIERCIRSVQPVADEIVVVDSYSTDSTKEICLRLGVRFVEHAFEGYVQQKNYAVSQASYDFVLALDADEALSAELQDAIAAVKNNWTHEGYKFNRLTNYCGKWIRHGGWYPDVKLRMWDRRKGSYGGINPHDSVKIEKDIPIRHLRGDLLHYSYDSIDQHIRQTNNFSTIMAEEYFAKNKKVYLLLHLIIYPAFIFFKRYVFQAGFLDGFEGLIISKNTAYYKFLKYAKLRKLYKDGSK